ncbi:MULTISPECIES: B12-binding domain-containing radical SAM protein [Aminobacterium]|jgi:hypothetical protein|uniref:Radical SAM domain protein n=1 Tax=Aminobacterium colombiense (strain DSM 12261 / ALA-1) TaxID=572547 RepID=D5ED37_AMICL|nr:MULTISPECIES: B12-binding domain-containing radical SAM protein [Aminobacterium]MDD2378791.1 B12-binding domain-containing radical SAM protein [Aminobacterium colombiense]ADE56469.1 Radical SAM domain protein [Aminobacterium colombiense DSM 12261]MDD3767329.1 B12-binding domain-containing radical SAM protein [Aminobacterium colombiense]MDD4266433.1 B12-binding domain-containing radical SAM protein [Aminobacterium colombiense]MDD4585346.1 B12-binding domain-containing radical SAM protein [Am
MSDYSLYLKSLHNKTILGINPPVFDFAYFDFWAKPLGLLYILETLREQKNSVYLIDCIYEGRETPKTFGRYKPLRRKVEKPACYSHIPRKYYHFGMEEEDFLERLKKTPTPDVILLTSGMTYWYPGIQWCLDRVKRIFPHTPVLLGGFYAQLCPEHARTIGANGVQTAPLCLESPYPALDLYNQPEYGVIMTSWGCPLHCQYCASKLLWPCFRQREVEEIIHEISFQERIPTVRDMAFYDDALLINKEFHFYPLCGRLRKSFSHLRFHTPNGLHVREIDEKCARVLFDTGFKTIRLSLESTDPIIQKASSEKVSEHQYVKAVTHLLRAGYSQEDIETYILIGLPGQRFESVKNAIEFVHSLGAVAKTAEYSPIPGTMMFEASAQKHPQLTTEPLLQNNTAYCGYISKEISPEELQILKNMAHHIHNPLETGGKNIV